MPHKKFTIALVDDMDVDQAMLSHRIKANKNYDIIFYATNGKDLLNKLKHYSPDIIVIDIFMPVMDGLSAIEHLRNNKYSGKILCISNGYDNNLINFLKQKAVNGFSRKDGRFVLRALDRISTGEEFWDTHLPIHNCEHELPEKCDESEINGLEVEIINKLATGMNSCEIGEELGYSKLTIETYIQSLIKRIGLKNRTQLASYGYVIGLFDNFESFINFTKPKPKPKPKPIND